VIEKTKALALKDLDVIRTQAKIMYFEGVPKREIAERAGVEVSTIVTWIKKFNWKPQKLDYLNEVAKEQLSLAIEHLNIDTAKNLDVLQLIKKKVSEYLSEDGSKPRNWSVAVDSLIESIKLEKQLKQEAFQYTLITEILKILKEEIQDNDLINRIGIRFGKLLGVDSQKKITETPKEIVEGEVNVTIP